MEGTTEGSEIERKLTKYSLGSCKRYGYAAKERIFFSGREKNRSHSGAMARIFDKAPVEKQLLWQF